MHGQSKPTKAEGTEEVMTGTKQKRLRERGEASQHRSTDKAERHNDVTLAAPYFLPRASGAAVAHLFREEFRRFFRIGAMNVSQIGTGPYAMSSTSRPAPSMRTRLAVWESSGSCVETTFCHARVRIDAWNAKGDAASSAHSVGGSRKLKIRLTISSCGGLGGRMARQDGGKGGQATNGRPPSKASPCPEKSGEWRGTGGVGEAWGRSDGEARRNPNASTLLRPFPPPGVALANRSR